MSVEQFPRTTRSHLHLHGSRLTRTRATAHIGTARPGREQGPPDQSVLKGSEPRQPPPRGGGQRTGQLRHPKAQTRACDCYLADPETGVVPGVTRDRHMRSRCRCSMCPAIHTNSRSWLRSSSTHEPSDPPLRVVSVRTFGHARPGNTGRDQGREKSHRADYHHPRFGIMTVSRKHEVSGRTCGTAGPSCGRPSLAMEDPSETGQLVLPSWQGKAEARAAFRAFAPPRPWFRFATSL